MSALLFASMLMAAAPVPSPRPVVVELFTSEGCSSCPPADEALRMMDGTAAAEGVDVVGLAFHVDYWNRLGWKDPFSEASFSERQQAYQDHFQSDSVFTPHFLVNGRTVRTSGSALREAFEKARSAPFVPVSATVSGEKELSVGVTVPALKSKANVLLAVTEKNLVSKVTAGENEGKTLELGPVVRKLVKVGSVGPAGGKFESKVALSDEWVRANTAVVVFVQDEDLKIVGAVRVPIGK